MPRIRRSNLPRPLYAHLLERVKSRNISTEQLALFADWLATQPEVPDGKWFKKFSALTVCGEGEFIKTFLQPGQVAAGKELN
jgi:hypothetical protein